MQVYRVIFFKVGGDLLLLLLLAMLPIAAVTPSKITLELFITSFLVWSVTSAPTPTTAPPTPKTSIAFNAEPVVSNAPVKKSIGLPPPPPVHPAACNESILCRFTCIASIVAFAISSRLYPASKRLGLYNKREIRKHDVLNFV